MGRIERERSQGRQDGALEVLAQLVAFDDREVVVIEDVDPRVGQRRTDLLAIPLGLPFEQGPDLLESRFPLFARRVAVRRLLGHAGRDLLFQPADALAEELVYVRRNDCEELHALKQRVVRVQHLVENATLKGELAEFAVQVVRRIREIDVRPGRLRAVGPDDR